MIAAAEDNAGPVANDDSKTGAPDAVITAKSRSKNSQP